jgi:hypothetical protein
VLEEEVYVRQPLGFESSSHTEFTSWGRLSMG